MIRVSKKKLEIAGKYVDTNNPKPELNHLYVDGEHLVSTNTRALAVVKHCGSTDGEFYISKDILVLALKQLKAVEFILEDNEITCIDKDNEEFLIISREKVETHHKFFKFIDYKRIIPKETEKNIPFIQSSSIDGIFAVNKVVVNNRYIPTLEAKNDDAFDGGYVGINANNSPVTISDTKKEMMVVLMPIIVEFPIFRDEAV